MAEQVARSLIRFATAAEEAASGLYNFRDELPRNAATITAIIGELFSISSAVRQIDNAQRDTHFAPSFYRIRDDLHLVLPTLRQTLDAVFNMFGRARGRPYQMVWDDLNHKMNNEEGISFHERLKWYREFLTAQCNVLTGNQPPDIRMLRRQLVALHDEQEVVALRAQRRTIDSAATMLPRTGRQRPPISRIVTPTSPTAMSDEWTEWSFPPVVPDAPALSPTFTSSSSHTLSSSHTSYSNDPPGPPRRDSPPFSHWALNVFNGSNPESAFRQAAQLVERSMCCGNPDSSALHHLVQDGFVRALELPFDSESLWMRFYFRPADKRARILIMAKDQYRRDLHYCTPLTNLKAIRQDSCLKLCRARSDGAYDLWARLNFNFYERMVLFYCTFVAMKHQDSRGVPHDDLLEEFELKGSNSGEKQEFGGMIRDGHLCHAFRIFRDRASGVVRFEASDLEGPMENIPLWTAFVTRYAYDPDWPQLENGNVVSLAAMHPRPYIFMSGYALPTNRQNEYVLQFTSSDDAMNFMQVWAGLCRARR